MEEEFLQEGMASNHILWHCVKSDSEIEFGLANGVVKVSKADVKHSEVKKI